MIPVVAVHLLFAGPTKDLTQVHLLPGLCLSAAFPRWKPVVGSFQIAAASPSAAFVSFLHVAVSPSAAFVSFLHVAVSPSAGFAGFLRVAAVFASFAVTPSTVFANFLRVAAFLSAASLVCKLAPRRSCIFSARV